MAGMGLEGHQDHQAQAVAAETAWLVAHHGLSALSSAMKKSFR